MRPLAVYEQLMRSLAVYDPDEKDPMQESLQILKEIAQQISDLRETQTRNTLSPRVQIAVAILAGWAANSSIDETSIPFSVGSALEIADSLLSDPVVMGTNQ